MEPERKRIRFEEPFLRGIIEDLGNEVKEKVFAVVHAKIKKIKKNEHLIAKLVERKEEKSDTIEIMKKDRAKILMLLTEMRSKHDEQVNEKETMSLENNVLVVEVKRLKELLETTQVKEQSDEITEPSEEEEVNIEPKECSVPTLEGATFDQEVTINNLKNKVATLEIEKTWAQDDLDNAMQTIENNLMKITNLQLINETIVTQSKEKDDNIKELNRMIVETAKTNQDVSENESVIKCYKAEMKVHKIENESIQREMALVLSEKEGHILKLNGELANYKTIIHEKEDLAKSLFDNNNIMETMKRNLDEKVDEMQKRQNIMEAETENLNIIIEEKGQKIGNIMKIVGTSQAEKKELETKVKHLEAKSANNVTISNTLKLTWTKELHEAERKSSALIQKHKDEIKQLETNLKAKHHDEIRLLCPVGNLRNATNPSLEVEVTRLKGVLIEKENHINEAAVWKTSVEHKIDNLEKVLEELRDEVKCKDNLINCLTSFKLIKD